VKILAVTGIRSDYDIIYPVLDLLRKRDVDVCVVVNGAHLSDHFNMTQNRIIEDGFRIADRVDTLLSTDRLVQRSKGVGMLIQGLSQTVEREKPDFLIVVGDREESIATAIVGNYMDVLVAHIAGGDPVYGNADDPMRFATSKLAHIHLCFAKEYCQNLINVGEEDFRINWVGNPSYVNIQNTSKMSAEELSSGFNFKIENHKYIVLIQHPLSSEVDDTEHQILTTLTALTDFCSKHDFKAIVIPPNSDPGSYKIKNAINDLENNPDIHVAPSLPRIEFINLIRGAAVLLGNSSMGILEAPFYRLPVVNVGNRQLGRLNAGNVNFVPHDVEGIITALEMACFDEDYKQKVNNLINPYGDETAAEKIYDVLKSINRDDRKWYVKKRLC